MALGWLVALSCEEQPIGLCLHLSMSTPTPTKTMPRPEALQMVLDVLGGTPVKRWVEEFKVDGVAAGRALTHRCTSATPVILIPARGKAFRSSRPLSSATPPTTSIPTSLPPLRSA